MPSEAKPKYAVVIQWSEEDGRYIASLPEWGPFASAEGGTYEEAARNAQEALETLMDDTADPFPQPAPRPKLFRYPGADVVDLPAPSSRARKGLDAPANQLKRVRSIA